MWCLDDRKNEFPTRKIHTNAGSSGNNNSGSLQKLCYTTCRVLLNSIVYLYLFIMQKHGDESKCWVDANKLLLIQVLHVNFLLACDLFHGIILYKCSEIKYDTSSLLFPHYDFKHMNTLKNKSGKGNI